MIILVKNKQTLRVDDFVFKCSVGRNGRTNYKTEGDKKTPRGIFSLGPVFFRKDRVDDPITKLRKIEIRKNMGWCDDIKSKKYNKLIKINNNIKHEKLFRKQNIYDLLVPINYNTSNPKKNKGSAIFLHLTNNYKKTAGCVALKKRDMLILIKLINKNTKIEIV